MRNGVKCAWFFTALVAALAWTAVAGCRGSSPRPVAEDKDKDKGDPPAARTTGPALEPAEAKALADDNHALAFALYARLGKQNPKANFAFSPHSIAEVLALAYRGAKGDTAAQLAKALHYSLPADRLPGALGALDRTLTAPPEGKSRIGLRLAEEKEGLRVEEVVADSPADKAGLKKGQRLVSIDGRPVRTLADYHALLADRPGPAFTFETAFGKNSTAPYRVVVPPVPAGEHQLSVANAVWANKDIEFRPDFLDAARQLGAAVESFDFGKGDSREAINGWFARKTAGQIKEVLAPNSLKPDTALVLTNALAFRGLWKNDFNPDATRRDTFHGPSGDVKVMMMDQVDKFRMYGSPDFRVLEMPFRDGTAVLDLILPEKRLGLAEFEKTHFTAENLGKWLARLYDRKERIIHVKVPRFQAAAQYDLKEVLGEMGVADAFSPKADFGRLAEGKDLRIGQVNHQATVEMDERGLTAAAASSVSVVPKSSTQEDSEFIADRPFLFVLRDTTTNTILFVGRVTEPQKAR